MKITPAQAVLQSRWIERQLHRDRKFFEDLDNSDQDQDRRSGYLLHENRQVCGQLQESDQRLDLTIAQQWADQWSLKRIVRQQESILYLNLWQAPSVGVRGRFLKLNLHQEPQRIQAWDFVPEPTELNRLSREWPLSRLTSPKISH
jgi:hypothetical protein